MGGLRGCWVFPLAFLARLWLHALPILNTTRVNRNVVLNFQIGVFQLTSVNFCICLKTGLLLRSVLLMITGVK